MQRFAFKGKETVCLFISVFVLGLFVAPQAREGDTVFAFNLHNLGRVLERIVQMPEDNNGPFRPISSEYKDDYLSVF